MVHDKLTKDALRRRVEEFNSATTGLIMTMVSCTRGLVLIVVEHCVVQTYTVHSLVMTRLTGLDQF